MMNHHPQLLSEFELEVLRPVNLGISLRNVERTAGGKGRQLCVIMPATSRVVSLAITLESDMSGMLRTEADTDVSLSYLACDSSSMCLRFPESTKRSDTNFLQCKNLLPSLQQ